VRDQPRFIYLRTQVNTAEGAAGPAGRLRVGGHVAPSRAEAPVWPVHRAGHPVAGRHLGTYRKDGAKATLVCVVCTVEFAERYRTTFAPDDIFPQEPGTGNKGKGCTA
jgi:hypothetical protein